MTAQRGRAGTPSFLLAALLLTATALAIAGCHPPFIPGVGVVPGGLPELQPRRVDVTTTPPGATVGVDGQQTGQSPWQGELPIGRHQVTVGAEGYRTVGRNLKISWRSAYFREHVYLPRTGALDYRIFNYQFVMSPQVLSLGDYTGRGAGFVGAQRFVFTVAKPWIGRGQGLIDVGFELANGFFFFNEDGEEFISYDGTRWRFAGADWDNWNDPYDYFQDSVVPANGFMGSLYFGVNIPLVVRNRPYLFLTFNMTHGINLQPHYVMTAALGLSIAASDVMELRFELASFRLQAYEGMMMECERDLDGECEWYWRDKTWWLAHYTPTFALSFRFH